MVGERIIYESLDPKVEAVKPEKLKQWLIEINERWKTIPELGRPKESLKSLAVICDGNRRAARARGLNPYFGHRAGVEVIKGVARASRQWGIKYLTFWTWSTENWQREERQVKYVMGLASRVLAEPEFEEELVKNQVHFVHLGRKDRLPKKVVEVMTNLEEKTAEFDRYWLNLAMDYGGLDEVARAVAEIAHQVKEGLLSPEQIEDNPSLILGFLDTRGQPVPDLIIRTGVRGGEIPHTSGLMPLQSAYACWDFVPHLFPDLTPQQLLDSAKGFIEYERRFGK
jgi:undecaprenyl diphosphate synthase